MRALKFYHISMIGFFCFISSYRSFFLRRLQPRAMVNAIGTAGESMSNAGRAGSTLKSGEEVGNTRALTFQKSIDNTPMASYQKNPSSAQTSGSSRPFGSGSISKGAKQPKLRR
jgi:hypothetical protein